MNRDNFLTGKEIYGRVRDKYWRLPTTKQYSVASSKAMPEWKVRVSLDTLEWIWACRCPSLSCGEDLQCTEFELNEVFPLI